MLKLNPFKPNSPVPTAMFAGRVNELRILENGLFRTKNLNASHFLITGERGIGKSSLMLYMKHVSSGSIPSLNNEIFNFLTVNISVSDKMDLVTFIKLIEKHISRELSKIEEIRSFLSATWSFVQRIKVMDSGIDSATKDSESDIIIDDFSYSLCETCKRITRNEMGVNKKDGIVFLIDELDNSSPDLRVGYLFKTVAESLQSNDCNSVMFVIAGLPEATEKLSSSHPSSIRIFTQLKISELSVDERKYVVNKGIEEGNKHNVEQTTISISANEQISILSEGYPHFIQQFAFAAFDANIDGEISDEDVQLGAFKPGGAIDAIGDRYYASAYHDKIKSDEYRQVLSIMAENLNAWVTKREIRAKFSGDETTLTNALTALTARKIILKNPSKVGEYRLQQKGFAVWIKLFGGRKKPA